MTFPMAGALLFITNAINLTEKFKDGQFHRSIGFILHIRLGKSRYKAFGMERLLHYQTGWLETALGFLLV